MYRFSYLRTAAKKQCHNGELNTEASMHRTVSSGRSQQPSQIIIICFTSLHSRGVQPSSADSHNR